MDGKYLHSSFRLSHSLLYSAVRTSLVSPSKVTLSYTADSGTFTTRVRDFPLKLDITVEKEGDIQGEKRSHHGNTEGQKSIERRQKTHTIRRHWQRHSWWINGATAGPSVTGWTQNRADFE